MAELGTLEKYLKDIVIKKEENMKYPIILDRDPKYAASALTIHDSEATLELMLSAFNSLINFQKEYPLIEYNIMYSQKTFDWFVDFTYKLIDLVEEGMEWNVPYEFRPEDSMKGLMFFPPVEYKAYKKRAVPKKFRYTVKSPIDKYRVIYISQMWDLEDFRDRFPIWYSLYESTLFEEYNSKTNVRVRISYIRGEFRYFICGASDNWQEIVNVPLEMDHIITALLFRN